MKIEELQKAIDEAAMAGVLMLRKSQMSFDFTAPNPHHVAYTRTNASGTVSNIAAKGVTKQLPTNWKDAHDHAENVSYDAWNGGRHTHLDAAKALRHSAAMQRKAAVAAGNDGDENAAWHHLDQANRHTGMSLQHVEAARASKGSGTVSNIAAKGAPKVEIKRVSSNEQNVSQRHVSYDIHVDGKYHSTHNDIIDAMDHKAKLENASQPAATPHKVGDNVHLGFGTKGGAGYFGKLTNIDGETAYVTNDEGRTFKGHISKLSAGKDAATGESLKRTMEAAGVDHGQDKHQQLLDGVHKVGNDLLNNPMMAAHHGEIKTMLQQLKDNPHPKHAKAVASQMKDMVNASKPDKNAAKDLKAELESDDFGMTEKGGNGRVKMGKDGTVSVYDSTFYGSNDALANHVKKWSPGGHMHNYFKDKGYNIEVAGTDQDFQSKVFGVKHGRLGHVAVHLKVTKADAKSAAPAQETHEAVSPSHAKFLKDVAKDHGITLEDQHIPKVHADTTRNSGGVHPDSAQYYEAAKEYFRN